MPPQPVQCPRCRFEFESEPKPGLFCPRCGELFAVKPGEGTPVPSPRTEMARAGRWKPAAASILLGIATGLTLLMAMASLAIDDIAAEQAERASGQVRIEGRVTDDELEPLPLVNVTVVGTNVTTRSDDGGRWSVRVEAGTYRLLFEKPGYRSVEYKVHAIDYPVDVELPIQMEPGSGTEKDELFARSSRVGFAVFFALSGLATLAAAVGAARRVKWAFTLIGSALGVVGGLPLLLGAACSLAALVLLATSRREFRS